MIMEEDREEGGRYDSMQKMTNFGASSCVWVGVDGEKGCLVIEGL